METGLTLGIDFLIILLLLLGFFQFRNPTGARRGNFTAAFALLCAFGLVIGRHGSVEPGLVLAALLLGGALGWAIAARIQMIQIPAMVAFQHGAGGIAACLIAFLDLTHGTGGTETTLGEVSGLLGLIIGTATFSGSMIAGGKLAGLMKQQPVVLRFHSQLLAGCSLAALLVAGVAMQGEPQALVVCLLILIGLSVLLGLLFSLRIGGADMPVLISFLNATAGLAAAFCGIALQNRLLIACGATVAASGSILTHVMCAAMNRGLTKVFMGSMSKQRTEVREGPTVEKNPIPSVGTSDGGNGFEYAISAARIAKNVVIIPGYGMALAQAQFQVVRLARRLEELGKSVKFAIHPVAGRMPGHMNVLLAEAEVDYEKLVEMEEINPEFPATDLALIVGACDVVNPAAIAQQGTPISGMPILMAHEADVVVVCNMDAKPGYSGVNNPLYEMAKTITLFGDAKDSLSRLLGAL
jgi:NAD(P) transhydrogenase subunit beta